MDIAILDSTLRDGEQAKGISFTTDDKLNIMKELDKFGVKYIEGGNPASNKKDAKFFQKAASVELKNSTLVAFGATRKCNTRVEEDEHVAALLNAGTDVITIVGKSWDMQVTDVLGTILKENLSMIKDTIQYLKENEKEVIFDAEHFFDGYKSNPEYALATLNEATKAGAKYVALCDTNGSAFPEEVYEIVKTILSKINCKVGVHCHNDMDLAVANSIMAVEAGATSVQGTFTGFGERSGNANLASIIPSLQLKKGYKCIPDESMKELTNTAKRISEIANVILPSNAPYVGSNAFAHKGGMHVDGVGKNKSSFEHISPSAVGNKRDLLFSDLAGRSALLDLISEIDSSLTKDDKRLTDIIDLLKRKEYKGYQYEIAPASLKLLVSKHLGKFDPPFKTELFRIIEEHNSSGDNNSSSALVKIEVDGEHEITAAEGNGPVNALDNALRKALIKFYPELKEMRLTDYKVRVIDPGGETGAKVRVMIESSDGNKTWNTIGVSEDVINASFLALTDSLEYKLFYENNI